MSDKKRTVGIILMVVSLILSLYLSYPTFNGEEISFESTYNNEEVTLRGTYYNNEGEYTVLVAPGYSCDRQKWRPVADMLSSEGFNVLLFDYSGQGASDGVIGFDNAKTDNIPKEIDDALVWLHENMNTDYSKIILLGHSMGGRSIIRLLYDYNNKNAITAVEPKDISTVILLSPEINYNYNAQASLFAGTSDENEEPWKSLSKDDVGNTDIYLIGSFQDDIVSDEDIVAIQEKVGGQATIVSGVLHSYMMYSPKIMKLIQNALEESLGIRCTYNTFLTGTVYYIWVMALIGIYLLISSFECENTQTSLKLIDERKFIISKLLLWIPGLIVAVLVCSLCVIMPFGSPVMNLPYMNFIAGYGIVMALAYKFKWVKGVEGKIDKINLNFDIKSILLAIGIFVYVIIILKGSMYNLIPLNIRLFWLVFCTLFMSVGYYVSSSEGDMLRGSKISFIYSIIQYIPLFLLVGFYLILKSYSGMIGQMANMIFMYMVCVPLGNYISSKCNNRLLGALFSSLLFQTFMITSAALIAIF
ncbi:MAG: alpha/beta fold hydrolase [Erysipelotrichaceae bacterium]|nr:alpha/beta fold hydrolase [Erysipelotrichaceae bacterium]